MVYKKLIATTGIVLAGSLTLAAPLQQTTLESETATTEKKLAQPTNPTTDYKTALEEALSDNFLSLEEAERIRNKFVQDEAEIVDQKRLLSQYYEDFEKQLLSQYYEDFEKQLLSQYYEDLEKQQSELRNIGNELESTVSTLEGLDAKMSKANPSAARDVIKQLTGLKQEFRNSILTAYPGLLKKDSSIVYSADTEIYGGIQEKFLDIVEETDGLLTDFCDYDGVSFMLEDETPNDVGLIVAYSEITAKINEKFLLNCASSLKTQKPELKEEIKKLEEQKKAQITENADLEKKIKKIEQQETNDGKLLILLSEHAKMRDEIQKYLSEHKNPPNKYYSTSAISFIIWNGSHDSPTEDIYNIINMQPQKDLENYLQEKFGKEIKIEKFKNPSKNKLPLWLTMPFGLIFPIFRNLALTKFFRKNSATRNSYDQSVFAGLVNGLVGIALIDGLHPLVYPIRMFATPFIIQPIRKAIRGDEDFIGDL
ncbi:hypothetical protein HY643_04480 [Candidatus Woesearchaeota archaeon]|nr:hypothetical protein [Candidatus Woesearchaeota archaeon]